MALTTLQRHNRVASVLLALRTDFPDGQIDRVLNVGSYDAVKHERDAAQRRQDTRILTSGLARLIPPLYANEHVDDPLVIAKFFNPLFGWTWYVLEGSFTDCNGIRIEPGEDNNGGPVDYTFFGLVTGFETELGYFTLKQFEEVEQVTGITMERDLYFMPVRLAELRLKVG